MKRKFKGAVLALAVIAVMLMGARVKVFADIRVDSWDTLHNAIVSANSATTIRLDGDIKYTGKNLNIAIGNKRGITLDLAGYTIDGTSTNSKATITVNKDGKLTIIDSSSNKSGRITGLQRGIMNSGNLTIYGITIESNENSNASGGGILNFPGGELYVYNAKIRNNTGDYGGGIDNKGKLSIRNVEITGNTAYSYGGGIYNEGTLTIEGGSNNLSGNNRFIKSSKKTYIDDLFSSSSNKWNKIKVSLPLNTDSKIYIATNVSASSGLGGTLPSVGSAWVITEGYKFTDASKSGFYPTDVQDISNSSGPFDIALDYSGNIILKPSSTPSLIAIPAAKTGLSYNGSAQQLITAGNVKNGKMKYAVTKTNSAPVDSSYSESIPTGTEAGTYYVWYKVDDQNYYNNLTSKPDNIPVTITGPAGNGNTNNNTGNNNDNNGNSNNGNTSNPDASTAPESPAGTNQGSAGNNTKHILNLKGSQTGSKVTLKWQRQKDASMYKVYGAYCGEKMKLLKTIKNGAVTKTTITKLNNKNLDLKKTYKFQIVAFKDEKGENRLEGSLMIHLAGRKNKQYTNIKAVKVKKTMKLKKGEKAKIKVKFVLDKKRKKALNSSHGAKIRYITSNRNVASVDKNGRLTANGVGTCSVYVYSINGASQKINVTVK